VVRRHLGADRDRQGYALTIVITGRRGNLAHLAASPRVRIVEADISAASNLPETVGPVDRVYPLASPASPADYARHPWDGSRRPTSRPGSSAH
jgi:dTDP-glucose 4,6-dehydratase